MSTNYTFYLKQDKPGVQRYRQQRKIDNRIFLQTKGVDAKAVDCGKDVTEVRHSSRSMSCKRYMMIMKIQGVQQNKNLIYVRLLKHLIA